eukprot:1019475-Pleurochrysis_carterae.AAC.1
MSLLRVQVSEPPHFFSFVSSTALLGECSALLATRKSGIRALLLYILSSTPPLCAVFGHIKRTPQ